MRIAWALWAALSFVAVGWPDTRNIGMVVGQGELLQFASDVVRVAVAEPKIADALVVSPREVMVNGKGPGRTTVVVWETGQPPASFDIRVAPDTGDFDKLRADLKAFDGSAIDASGNEQSIVLTGTVKSSEESKRAAALAGTRSKNVVNLLQAPTPAEPRQILLEVKFASVDRTKLQEFGFNLFSQNPSNLGSTSTQQFAQPRFAQLQNANGSPRPAVNFSDILNLFYYRADLDLGATIRAMQQRDVLEMLAEPNLIAVEGKSASFLAGGQFPFPTITSTTTGGAIAPVITVQFKKFGVQLDFLPTITATGAIDLKVSPEVSSLDYTNAVTLEGFQIPALTTRTADTEVVLKDGESFAIAGLIDNRVTQTLSKIPGLGDIPILGRLFKSNSTQKTNTELVVVITPHFIRPLAPGEKAKLPPLVEPFLPALEEAKAAIDAKKKHAEPEPQPQKP